MGRTSCYFIRITLLALFIVSNTSQANVRRAFRDFYAIQEELGLNGVLSKGVREGRVAGSPYPFVIEVEISATSACGDQFLVKTTKNVTRFYQIGKIGPYIQPGCHEILEYFVELGDKKIPIGESAIRKWFFASPSASFELSARVTRHLGQFPGGYGNYFTYTNIQVRKLPARCENSLRDSRF